MCRFLAWDFGMLAQFFRAGHGKSEIFEGGRYHPTPSDDWFEDEAGYPVAMLPKVIVQHIGIVEAGNNDLIGDGRG